MPDRWDEKHNEVLYIDRSHENLRELPVDLLRSDDLGECTVGGIFYIFSISSSRNDGAWKMEKLYKLFTSAMITMMQLLCRSPYCRRPMSLFLQSLCFNGNQLTTLPLDLFEKLFNLTWLDLRSNFLAELPREMGLLRSLRTLLLDDNQLRSLPAELSQYYRRFFAAKKSQL